MLRKILKMKIKGAGPDDGLEEGQFIGYASVFGNIDLYGDKVIKGAFSRTLKDWKSSDQLLPLLYGHDTRDPNNNIGWSMEAEEDDHGLLVKCQIDLEGGNGPQVYRLVKGRRLGEMSFAYEVKEGAWIQSKDEGDHYELRDLDLFEVSLVPIGANRETELLAVKELADHVRHLVIPGGVGAKAGRVLSTKNETVLKEAQSMITEAANRLAEVLSAVQSEEEKSKNDSASDEPPAKSTEEPSAAKVDEEPPAKSSVDAMLAAIDAELVMFG